MADDSVANVILSDLAEGARHHHCHVSIYCLMPDHLHAVLTGTMTCSDTLSAMKRFKQRNSFHLKAIDPALLWQKDFYDEVLGEDDSLSDLVFYIAANPVRKGLVRDWRQYQFTGSFDCRLEDVMVAAAYVADSRRAG